MKKIVGVVLAMTFSAALAYAHGDAEHVRGTVTSVSATSISVQTPDKKTRTISLDAKAMVMRGSSHLTMGDVKVGDRVVIDVDKKTSLATEITLGAAKAASTAKGSDEHAHKD
jgi:hypothetical protein